MKFGLLVAPGPQAAKTVQRAEALGFDSAFFLDSPVVFGDPYVSMAASAVQTTRIMLATGVTNPLTRSAPVTASSLASLNALAPGRIALGIGVGYTANLAMGYRNASAAELELFVETVKRLLRAEVTEVRLAEREVLVQFLNPDGPWINLKDRIRVYIAAAGPRTLRMAGRIADAIILGGVTNVDLIDACRRYVAEGAQEAGRAMDEIELAITPSAYVTEDEPSVEHLREVLGPKSLSPAANFSRIAELSQTVPRDVVDDLRMVRDAYKAAGGGEGDPRRRHLTAFRGYMTELKDWQYPLVTPNVLEATSIAGTPDQCSEKISRLEQHGIGQIILSPLPQFADQTLESYGLRIVPRVAERSQYGGTLRWPSI